MLRSAHNKKGFCSSDPGNRRKWRRMEGVCHPGKMTVCQKHRVDNPDLILPDNWLTKWGIFISRSMWLERTAHWMKDRQWRWSGGPPASGLALDPALTLAFPSLEEEGLVAADVIEPAGWVQKERELVWVARLQNEVGTKYFCSRHKCQGPLNGGVSRSGLVLPFCPFLSLFGLSRFFRDFPDSLGDGPGIFPIRSFSLWILGLLRAPTRNSPERVRDTIWTFPEKSGKPRFGNPPV